jgi:hypothetical protein
MSKHAIVPTPASFARFEQQVSGGQTIVMLKQPRLRREAR